MSSESSSSSPMASDNAAYGLGVPALWPDGELVELPVGLVGEGGVVEGRAVDLGACHSTDA